jgi:hypothetical protein
MAGVERFVSITLHSHKSRKTQAHLVNFLRTFVPGIVHINALRVPPNTLSAPHALIPVLVGNLIRMARSHFDPWVEIQREQASVVWALDWDPAKFETRPPGSPPQNESMALGNLCARGVW